MLVNPCTASEDDCVTTASCNHDGPAQHSCTCPLGFFGDGTTTGSGSGCSDINECTPTAGDVVVCGGTSTCTNGLNKYTCNCAAGWEGGGDDQVCTDVNDCAFNPCTGTTIFACP